MASPDFKDSRVRSLALMSTAITTSAPIALATSTGMLLTVPPSARMWPSHSTGLRAPGMDMDACIALARLPWSSTKGVTVSMSVAMAR